MMVIKSADGSEHGLYFWTYDPNDEPDYEPVAERWVYPRNKDPLEFAQSLREFAREIEEQTAKGNHILFEDCQ